MLNNQQGAAALVAIIIVTAMVVLISISLAYISINNLEFGFASQRSGDVILSAESCAEEAMYRLSSDNSYSGGSLTVGDVDCTITVSGAPCGTCTISVEAEVAGFTRNIDADVTVTGSNVEIDSWEEVN